MKTTLPSKIVKTTDTQDETRRMLRELKILKPLAIASALSAIVVPLIAVVVSMAMEVDLEHLCNTVFIGGMAVCLFSLVGILTLRKELKIQMNSTDWKNLIYLSLIILEIVGIIFHRFSVIGIILLICSTYKYFKLRKSGMPEHIEKKEIQ